MCERKEMNDDDYNEVIDEVVEIVDIFKERYSNSPLDRAVQSKDGQMILMFLKHEIEVLTRGSFI